MDLESVESKPSVQESIGIFQLIEKLERTVDNLLERQVYFACRVAVQVGVIKTNVAIQYCSKCLTLLNTVGPYKDRFLPLREHSELPQLLLYFSYVFVL
jgi:hypothetical protein